MTGSSHKEGKPESGRVSNRTSATIKIKCSFCGNTFYARVQEAVCPKCERPANRDLPALWRAISLFLPPVGLIYALVIRAHSPVAALQALKWSLLGAALIFAAFALLRAL